MTEKPEFDLTAAKSALDDFVARDGQEAADKLTKIFATAAQRIANELSRGALRSRTPLQQVAGGLLGHLGVMAVDRMFSKTAALSPASSKSNHAPNSSVTVNVQAPHGASAEGLHRSAAQIATHVARAVDYGRRNG
jgi:hypothetical protein